MVSYSRLMANDNDPALDTRPARRDISDTPMAGSPADFAPMSGVVYEPAAQAELDKALAAHRLWLRVHGVFYESPMADLPRGGR